MSNLTDQSVGERTELSEIIAKVIAQLESGQMVRWEQLIDEHPQLSDELRQIRPALEGLRALGGSLEDTNQIAEEMTNGPIGTNHALGDFQIIREIGRGGMGVVYEAQQLSVSRRVALKVLPMAALLIDKALNRFRNEVRAAASLEHPNIVSVYTLGEERGIHYYAMRLVRGKSLATVIRDLQAIQRETGSIGDGSFGDVVSAANDGEAEVAADSDIQRYGKTTAALHERDGAAGADAETTRDTVAVAAAKTTPTDFEPGYFRTVARLAIQAAEALDHAHQQGVIHRDVKPGNLLLDKEGTLFITDFGLARIEADAGITLTGDILGTLRYMSPEQVSADHLIVDHRTDIYSLGATIFELLTLRPIWSGDDRAELIRRISLEEPTRPGRLNSEIPEDLETIVLKSISKNPFERYLNARAMSDDLQRWLEQKPITARRPTLVQRLTKWTRRNPAIMWSTFSILLIMVTASAMGNYFVLKERKAKDLALIDAQQKGDLANRNFIRARAAVDEYLTRVSEEIIFDNPGMQPLRKELLELALRYYQQFISDYEHDKSVQGDLAIAYLRFGKISNQTGSLHDSVEALLNARHDLSGLLAQYPAAPDYIVLYGETLHELGNAKIELGEASEALALHEEELQIWNSLEKMYPAAVKYSSRSAMSLQDVAAVHKQMGNYELAFEFINEAIRIAKVLVSTYPGDLDHQYELANYIDSLANLEDQLGHTRNRYEIIAMRLESLAIRESLVNQEPDSPKFRKSLGASFHNLSRQQTEVGQYEEAEQSQQSAIVHKTLLAKQHPFVTEYKWRLASSYDALARIQHRLGKLNDAMVSVEKGVHIKEQLVEQYPSVARYEIQLARSCVTESKLLDELGDRTAALACAEQAVSLRRDVLRQESSHYGNQGMLARNLQNLAFHRQNNGLTDAAIDSIDEAIQIQLEMVKQRPSTNRAPLATSYRMLGRLTKEKGLIEKAIGWGEKALAIRRNRVDQHSELPAQRQELALSYNDLACFHQISGDAEDALPLIESAIEIGGQLVDEYPKISEYREVLANSYSILSSINQELELPAAALDTREAALTHYKILTTNNPDHSDNFNGLVHCHIWAGDLQKIIGQEQDAEQHYRAAIDLLTDHPESARGPSQWGLLARVFYRMGQYQDALDAAARSIELHGDQGPRGQKPRWWILTLSHARLGIDEDARKFYFALIKDQDVNQDLESRLYHDEAASLLGIELPTKN